MREETGINLAAKFMVLLNQIKEKSALQEEDEEKSNTENQEIPLNQSKKKLKNN